MGVYLGDKKIASVYKTVSTSGVVEDNLDSFSVSNALSANQGRVLNEKIETNKQSISNIDNKLNTEIKKVQPVANGGTGATNPADARRKLEVTKVYNATWKTDTSSIPANMVKNMAYIILPEGTYFIHGELRNGFSNSDQTYVQYSLTGVEGGAPILRTKTTGGGGGYISTIASVTEGTKVYFTLWTDAYSEYNPNHINLKAVRLS